MFNFTWPSEEDDEVLRAISSRDWRSSALALGDRDHEDLAARAVALGAVACHGFANFYAISTHPSELVVRYVNQVKGRPPDQVGSLTTTREHIAELFDWSQLPESLTQDRIMELVDRLLELGPFGFRGPAAEHIPQHLSAQDGEIRTTQLIAPGYRCPSNQFLARCIEGFQENFLYITSANVSRHATGNSEEPAHWRLPGLQQEFGHVAGILMLAHGDEHRAHRAYPRYAPSSTTILGFHRVAVSPEGRVALRVERHGSLHIDDLRPIVAGLGFDLQLTPKAQQRQPIREYDDESDLLVA
jgi:hypothetical protein